MAEKLKIETRYNPGTLVIRAEADARDILTGRPIVYASPTDIGGWFREVIAPGALEGADLSDVRLCLNHDTDYVYARARKGSRSNTMVLTPTDAGLDFSAQLSDSPAARDLYAAVSRGDISGMSFMFTVSEESWEGLDTDYPTRTITRIGTVIEISAVTFPAYEATTINARDGQVALESALESARRTVETARSKNPQVPAAGPVETGTDREPGEKERRDASALALEKAKLQLYFIH